MHERGVSPVDPTVSCITAERLDGGLLSIARRFRLCVVARIEGERYVSTLDRTLPLRRSRVRAVLQEGFAITIGAEQSRDAASHEAPTR